MELGTGVFLSAVFLGIVVLFIFTKDRWNWKKIMLILLGAPITIGLLTGGGVASYKWYKETFPPTLNKQTGFEQIELGMIKNEVRYIYGQPQVLEKVSDGTDFYWYVEKIPDDKTVNDYDMWEYNDKYKRILTVNFDSETGKVSSLSCQKGESSFGKACEIQDLRIGLTEEELTNRLGKPTRETLNGLIKKLYYSELNLIFFLEKKKVYLVKISE
jgi:hypothetical protein